MKKWNFVLMGLLLLSLTRISAQDYYMSSPIGYGRAATGGGNATPVIVTTYSQLSSALTASGPGVILIQGSIQVDYLSVLATNKTILGLPGSKLFTNNQTAGGSGILYFKAGTKNLIIRNVTFVGPGAYDSDGRDCLTFDGATDCWVDHCDFQDGMDGNFDNKGNTDNITVSWCKFSYNKPPKAGGSGGSDDHRYTNLVGSNSSDYPKNTSADTQYSITWQNCWWAQGCVERMVRARNAQLHMLNCFWNSSVAKKCIGLEDGSNGKGTQCYVEGGVFETPSSTKNIDVSYGGTPDVTVVGSVGNGLANYSTTVTKPSYTYTALSSSQVKAALTSSCGAGATLNVTTSGVVSSPCNGEPPVEATLALLSGSASQSVTVNTAISNIVYSYGGSATGVTVTGLPSGVSSSVNSSAKTVTISGTPTSVQTAAYTVSTLGGSSTVSLNGTITSTSTTVITLAVPSSITASATQTSATISWGAVANATGYTVNLCNGGGTGSSNVALLLNSTSATSSGVYTLNTGDQYKTTASISTSGACSPSGSTNIYRSGSINVNSLKLVNTTGVTKLTIGAKSSGSTVRNLSSYSINGGAQITSGITQSGSAACGEYTINGLNLSAGNEIAFVFDGNVQISYFIASAGTSSCTETAVTGTSFTATGLTANTSYTYQVKATNSNAGYVNSAYSNPNTVTTTNTVTNGSLVLTTGSANQSIVLGSSITPIVYTYGGSATGATVTGLPDGVSSSVNTSAKTVTISGTPTSVQSTAYTVTTTQSSGTAAALSGTITTTAPASASLVLTSGSANQSIVLGSSIASIVYTYGGSATGATVTGLPGGVSSLVNTSAKTVTISGTPTSAQSATYTVTTSQSSGSAAALSGTITAVAPIALAVPTNITSSATQTSATISWDAVTNATGYTVSLCSGSTTTSSNVVMLLNSTSATSTGVYTLNTGDHYKTSASISTSGACSPAGYTNTYRSASTNNSSLKLVNTTGVSALVIGAKSGGASVRTLVSYSINGGSPITTGITQSGAATCGEYRINGLNLSAGNEIAFVFDGNVQISYFIATAGTTGGVTCTETNVTGTSFTPTGLATNTSYTYQIKATSSNSAYLDSAYSTAANFTTNSAARYAANGSKTATTVTEDETSTSGFQCYPTLVENEVQILFPETGDATITVFDLSGRQITTFTTKERNTTLNLSSLTQGVYIVLASQNGNLMQQRIIKK
ncbi:MAG: T9SS type A sorting domain-containing protein [Bacteroidota bacterium]